MIKEHLDKNNWNTWSTIFWNYFASKFQWTFSFIHLIFFYQTDNQKPVHRIISCAQKIIIYMHIYIWVYSLFPEHEDVSFWRLKSNRKKLNNYFITWINQSVLSLIYNYWSLVLHKLSSIYLKQKQGCFL